MIRAEVHAQAAVHKTPNYKGDEGSGYVYMPKDWVGHDVILLTGVANVEVVEDGDGVVVSLDADGYTFVKAWRKGDGSAVHVSKEGMAAGDVVVALEPTRFDLAKPEQGADA